MQRAKKHQAHKTTCSAQNQKTSKANESSPTTNIRCKLFVSDSNKPISQTQSARTHTQHKQIKTNIKAHKITTNITVIQMTRSDTTKHNKRIRNASDTLRHHKSRTNIRNANVMIQKHKITQNYLKCKCYD